jgi:hypothetical protein
MKKCVICSEIETASRRSEKSLNPGSTVVFFWGPPSSGLIGLFGRLSIVIDGFEQGNVGFLRLAKININSGTHEIFVKMGNNISVPLEVNLSPDEEKHFTCKLKEGFVFAYHPISRPKESFEIIEYTH